MITGIDVPLEVALFACAVFAGAGVFAGRVHTERALAPRGLLFPKRLGAHPGHAVNLASYRDRARAGAHAVLHARIERAGTGHDCALERQQMLDHIAAVMRAGLRRDELLRQTGPDDITIMIPGADEKAAMRIARRLRARLSRLSFPHLPGHGRFTASFGVAAQTRGAASDLDTLARRALAVALDPKEAGRSHVVAASEIEEVIYLPPPPADHAASAA